MKKIKVLIACWGTVIAVAIIVSVFFFLVGIEEKIGVFFYLHFSIGTILIFLIFWPFFSKKIK